MNKYNLLVQNLASYKSMIIAFSGGVDSTLLVKAAYEALGDKALAITFCTPYIQKEEIALAKQTAQSIGIAHLIFTIEDDLTQKLQSNPQNRCYICKHHLFEKLKIYAKEKSFLTIAEGSNIDDTKEYRPGRKAIQELGIISPLLDASFSKEEIRSYSLKLGLATWNKPSSPCLLTRFEYDTKVEISNLHLVEEAEKYLFAQGYIDVRVRFDNHHARIEMPFTSKQKLLSDPNLPLICEKFKILGFSQVTLDLQPFRHEVQFLGDNYAS